MKRIFLSSLVLAFSIAAFAGTDRAGMIGCWFSPENGGQHIELKQDGSYKFNTGNGAAQTGTWEIKGDNLVLTHANGAKEAIPVQARSIGYTINYQNGFMVKGDNNKCE